MFGGMDIVNRATKGSGPAAAAGGVISAAILPAAAVMAWAAAK